MIKIIKDGVKPKICKVIFTKNCSRCGCEFEFETEDCLELSKSIFIQTYKIKCPCCGIVMCDSFDHTKSRTEELE